MDKDYVPAWLVTLVGVFGGLTAITFVAFLHFHADLAAANEARNHLARQITDLRGEKGALESERPQIEQQIAMRYARIADKKTSDAEGSGFSSMLKRRSSKPPTIRSCRSCRV